MPLTVPPTTTGLLDAETLTTYTAAGGLLTRQLDAVVGSRVAIGLDPMIVASIRVLGTAAPAPALAFLERLQTVVQRGLPARLRRRRPGGHRRRRTRATPLGPLGFDFAIDPADFGPAVTPTPTTSRRADRRPRPGRDRDPGRRTAPAADHRRPARLAGDASRRSPGPPRARSTPTASRRSPGWATPTSCSPGSNASQVSTALVDLGDIDGIVTDDAGHGRRARRVVRRHPDRVSGGGVPPRDRPCRTAPPTNPGRTIVATLDRRWPFGTLRIPDVLTAIDAAAASQLVTLSDVLAGPRGGAQLVEPRADATADRLDTIDPPDRGEPRRGDVPRDRRRCRADHAAAPARAARRCPRPRGTPTRPAGRRRPRRSSTASRGDARRGADRRGQRPAAAVRHLDACACRSATRFRSP